MKDIKYVGKQVFDNELEEGDAEIIINIDEFLDNVDTEILTNYVEYHLDLIHPDNCNCETIEEATESDLIWELKNRYFDFIDEVDEDEMVDYLQRNGYLVQGESSGITANLDLIDTRMLEEITSKFLNTTIFERGRIYKLVQNA